jgi:hypothetical protein
MRISIYKADLWVRALQGEMRAAALRGLYSAAIRLKEHIVTDVIPSEDQIPVDRGIYRAGWKVTRLPDGAMVSNSVPYAVLIEEGVRASNIKIGRKMIDAIAEWVRRKGIFDTQTKSGKRKKPTKDEARQIAWAIAMKMKGTANKEGTGIFNGGRGLRILEKANRMVPKYIDDEVNRELKKVK